MKSFFFVMLFLVMPSQGFSSFRPFTLAERIEASDIIAVIKCERIESGSRATGKVVKSLLGTKEGDTITIMVDSRVGGRDPNFQIGQQYLVFLKREAPNRLVSVQSSFDAFEIKKGRVSHWEIDVNTNKFIEPKLSDLIPILRKLIDQKKTN
jgi:hypothetical protein